MNHEQEANSIATYAIIQETINNTSNLVIQVFGFSIAGIITIVLAAIATESSDIVSAIVLYFFAALIILLSSNYIYLQTKSLIETEAYVAVFIEPKLHQYLQWRKKNNKIKMKGKSSNKFSPPLLNFLEFLTFAYTIILCFIAWLVNNAISHNAHNTTEKLNLENKLVVAAIIIAIGLILFSIVQPPKYIEKYYQECKQDFENQRQQEESLKPSQAKLVDSNGKEISIPESTYQVLRKVTEVMVSGQAVSVIAKKDEVSIQEAADILNVSRSFLMKLLEERKIPFTKVGSYQYIRFEDLMTYKQQRNIQRQEGLTELTQFLQEEGFYGDEAVKFDS